MNDSAKLARVRVEGLANGEPFTVERSVRRCASVVASICPCIIETKRTQVVTEHGDPPPAKCQTAF